MGFLMWLFLIGFRVATEPEWGRPGPASEQCRARCLLPQGISPLQVRQARHVEQRAVATRRMTY